MNRNALIVSGKYETYKAIKWSMYQNGISWEDYKEELPFEEIELQELNKIDNSVRQRKYRSKIDFEKWIFAILFMPKYKDCKIVFGTLTFRNDVLDKTSKETRRRYVARFLNKTTIHYKANIDFGKKNDREHYHFLALVEKPIPMSEWVYGGNKIREVQIERKELEKAKAYLLKINNHSFKDTTRQEKLICDKNNFDQLENIIDLVHYEEFRRFKMNFS